MKPRLLFSIPLALLLAACDQGAKQEAQRLADERAALEREKAELATQKLNAQQAANDAERAKLDADRAALDRDKARMASDRETQALADRNVQIAREREKRMEAEQAAAKEAAARQEAEVREREAKLAAEQSAQQARSAQTVDFFYDALDPYGDWVEVDRYGYAFRPKAARDLSWRPYTDGGWVYTDYGWTWRSEEPFGWATYHYGRWARAPRLGWVWIPGSEWGPAWVSWRRGHDYVGWAPLPPDAWSSHGFNAAVDSYYDIGPGLYVFLRTADFGESTYRGRVVAPEQNVTIINQTVNVTKVVYQKIQNKVTVVNNGPDLAVINQVSRRPVPHLAVQRVATGAPQPARVEGNVLQLTAPEIKGAPPAGRPKAVKDAVKTADLDHGWRDAKSDESRLREEAKKEAHRAEENERNGAPVKSPLPPRESIAPRPPVSPVATPAPLPPVKLAPSTTPLPAKLITPIPPRATPVRPLATPRLSKATPSTDLPSVPPRPFATPRPPTADRPPAATPPLPERPIIPTRPTRPDGRRPEPPLPREGNAPLKQFREVPSPNANPTPIPAEIPPGEKPGRAERPGKKKNE